MERTCIWNWIVEKVQQTQQTSDVILKDELFQAFQAENPDVPRDRFFSWFGRFMGSAPFNSGTPHKKKGKLVGYCYLSFKNDKTSESAAPKHNQYVSHDEVLISIKEKEITESKTTKKRKSCHGIAGVVFENEPQNKISKMSNCKYQIGKCSVEGGNLSKQTGVEKASKSETNITDTTESWQGVDVVLEKGEVNEEVFVKPER